LSRAESPLSPSLDRFLSFLSLDWWPDVPLTGRTPPSLEGRRDELIGMHSNGTTEGTRMSRAWESSARKMVRDVRGTKRNAFIEEAHGLASGFSEAPTLARDRF